MTEKGAQQNDYKLKNVLHKIKSSSTFQDITLCSPVNVNHQHCITELFTVAAVRTSDPTYKMKCPWQHLMNPIKSYFQESKSFNNVILKTKL
jgi:hypothetical protein